MNIDFHVHTSPRSSCAWASAQEQAQAAQQAGLQGIVFTDHHCLTPAQELQALEQQFAPLRVWGGVEVSLGEDFLVLGIHHPALESSEWNYPDLWRFVRQQGGYLVLAHPFRYANSIRAEIDRFPPDAIELHSHNTPVARAQEILAIAQRLGCAVLSNSDAHVCAHLGKYYNHFSVPVGQGADLLELLRCAPAALFYDGQVHPYPIERECADEH
ncbi:MAG: PHP domain-containing protein [Longilinea sp.]|nr:PHP domain-containing protein [Longilinea sp.]